jgi:3D (Asp-Asp-Asp) domain-containing protein
MNMIQSGFFNWLTLNNMKILKYIREEIIPLSRKQNLVLLIIIACVFQFVLFYAPALADEAVKTAQAQGTGLNTNYDDYISINDATIINKTTANEGVTKANSTVINTASSTPADTSIQSTVASSTPTSTASSTPVKVIRTSSHVITAYNSEVSQTDDDPCTTANGYNLCKNNKEDSIAANFLKFGTKVRIPELFGDKVFVVRDRMNARHATRVDVWMKNHSDAIKFGVKTAKIEVIE